MSSVNKNLLVELFVEELPPKSLKKLGEAFGDVLANRLKVEGLVDAQAKVTGYASPRRLAVHVEGVAARAADRAVSQKLMPVAVGLDASGNATPALVKKLASLGLDASVVPALKRQPDGKAEALFHDSVAPGASLAEGLQKAIEETLAKLPIPKVMQYQLADGWSSVNFVRPAHGLVALHGADVVPVKALGLDSGRITHGHRFEAKRASIELRDADSYATQLRDEGAVIASFDARRADIVDQLQAAAAKQGLKPIDDDALLDEVTALVERPNVLTCQFEREFLDVPQECLILTMKANQKYFPLLDAQGKLTHQFLVVSNIRPDDASRVIEGNERVVRPRLADAKFFFDQDRKKTLESRVSGLDKVVYHGKLGTQGERVQRVRAIAQAIAEHAYRYERISEDVDRAARLAKADLLTGMVGEFPELQGVMGGYYARHDRESVAVAEAIEDHYKPRFAGDALPRGPVGLVVALADKLETLVGLFGIGQLPTGDKDPFALRRHALGVIRILAEVDRPISLGDLLASTVDAFPQGMLLLSLAEKGLQISLATSVRLFVEDRAAGWLRDKGYTAHEVDALFALRYVPSVDLVPSQYEPRLKAIRVAKASHSSEMAILANADKRARNILSKSGGSSEVERTNEQALVEPQEIELLHCTRDLRSKVDRLVDNRKYEDALLLTVQIATPVSKFFDSVLVNSDDIGLRQERFRLLHEVIGLTNRVADLSKLAA